MICSAQKIKMINVKDIIPNPYQVRKTFEKNELEKLCRSIKEVGLLSPIIVRRAAEGYELICGQRRLRACIMAEMKEIPAFVVRAGDVQCAQLSILENIHRKNLSFFEEAEAFYNLVIYHRVKKGKATEMLACNQGEFNEKIRLLSLASETRRIVESEGISEEFAKELLRIHNEDKQAEIARKTADEELSLKTLRLLADTYLKESVKNEENAERKSKKEIIRISKIPIYVNTVRKTADLLKRNGAKFEFKQNEDDKKIEFIIKIEK